MAKLPASLRHYFWDTDAASLDYLKHPKYVAERLLAMGDLDSWQWLGRNYSQAELIEIIKSSRQLSKKDANFYSLIFNLPKKELTSNRLINHHYPWHQRLDPKLIYSPKPKIKFPKVNTQ